MRKDFGPKPWVYPLPVYIIGTYDENNTPNAMMLTWGGIYNEKSLHLYLSNDHKTTSNIMSKKEFTVSMATVEHMSACDYIGTVSGNDYDDKVSQAGFHVTKATYVNAPIIEELPLTLECKLVEYDIHTCHLVAEIINVSADEKILTQGVINPSKLRPLLFDTINNTYLEIGSKVGNIYEEGKNPSK